MKAVSPITLLTLAALAACAADTPAPASDPGAPKAAPTPAGNIVVSLPQSTPRPPFPFSPRDDAFLDEIEHATFRYFWEAVDPTSGMVPDRTGAKAVSTAGLGYQLTAFAIGAQRGYVTKDEARARAIKILRLLEANPHNRKAGVFFHFVESTNAGPTTHGYEATASTIDSALLFAGMLTASSYFGGEVAAIADRLFADADWTFYVSGDEARPYERGYISLGWKPKDKSDPTGDGTLMPFYWADAGDEQLLVNFLAEAAPVGAHRPDPTIYYRLRRRLGTYQDIGPFVWFPWSGAMFTNVFAHLWIDYAAMGIDDPSAHDVDCRPRVDWWANSYMAAEMQRRKAIENPQGIPTLGPNAWAMTACDSAKGYSVPGLFPTPLPMPGCRPKFDYTTQMPQDDYGDGTIAPYGAGMTVIFQPSHAIAALRHYRSLKGPGGQPLVWREDRGFVDSFNSATGWVATDCVAIDQGALLLAIENARSGFVWDQFHTHRFVAGAMERLGLQRSR